MGQSGEEGVEDVLVLNLLVALEELKVCHQVGEDSKVRVMVAEVGLSELEGEG